MFFMIDCLKLVIDTVAVYAPACNDGIENVPLPAVIVWNCAPVASSLTATSAPGITPPDASITVPVRAELAPCP
jgi:hypothetical protein